MLSALLGAGAWLAGTTGGLRFLAARALPFLPATFDPAQIEGSLLGRISFGRIELAADAVSGSIERVELEWRPAALVQRTLHLAELRVVEPRLAWLGRAPAAVPARASLSLPVTVRVDALAVVDAELRTRDAPVVAALNLELAGQISEHALDLRRVALRSSRGQLSGYVHAALATGAPWQVRLDWQLVLDGAVVGGETRVDGVTERLQVSHALSPPLAAQVAGIVHGLPDAPAWRLDVRVEPLPAGLGSWPDVLTGFAATLAIEGDLAASTVGGQIELPSQVDQPVPIAGRIGWRDGAVAIETLELGLPDAARMTVGGRFDPGREPAIEFTLAGVGLAWPLAGKEPTLELPTFDLSGRGMGDRWHFDAKAHARRAGVAEVDLGCALQLDGPLLTVEQCDLDSPDGALSATVRGGLEIGTATRPYRIQLETEVELAGYPRVDATLRATGDAGSLQVEKLTAELLDGHLDGAGRVSWTAAPAVDFEATFRDLDPAGVAASWPGRLSGALRVQGSPRDPDGLAIELGSLRGQLRALPVAGAATLELAADARRLRGARVELGRAFVKAEGSIVSGTVALDLALDAPALEQLHPDAGGGLSATARIRGRLDAPTLELEAAGDGLRWAGHRARELRIAGLVDLSGARKSRIAASMKGYAAGSGAGGDVRLAVDGRPTGHQIRLDYAEASREGELVLEAAGGVTGDRWTGAVGKLSVVQAQRELWALQSPARVSAGPDSVALGKACLDGLFGALCFAGDWYGGGIWDGWATLAGLDLAPSSEWLGVGLRVRGTLDGRVDVAADAGGFRGLAGRLSLTAGDLRLPGERSGALLAWDGGVLDLAGASNEARATVDVDLSGEDRLEGHLGVGWNAADPPLRGQLDAELRQLQWLTEIVPDLADVAGRATLRAGLSGTIGAPVLKGRFEWVDGTAYVPTLGLRPNDLGVVAELADGVFDFSLRGRSGEGVFRSTGRFEIGGGGLAGRASLQGENVLVAALPDARVAADPDLRMDFSDRSITVEGEVRIPSARISGEGRPAAVGVSRDEVLVGTQAAVGRPPGLAIASRVRVTAGEDVRIRVAGLRGAIRGSVLTAVQPDAPPWGRGELRIADGTFNVFGQRLEIERGRLIYTGGALDNPGLEIRTVRRVGNVTAGAQVRGTLQQPEVSVFSDPPMARAEAVAYLTFGTSLRDLQSSERGAVNQAAGSLAVSGGGGLTRDMSRRLGLSDADLTIEGGAQGAALVMGRYLGGDLYVSYGLGLFDTVNTLRLRLRINSRVSLEAASGDAVTADLIHTVERD